MRQNIKGGILGIGYNCDDGHTRITRGDNLYVVGGSQDTHEMLREVAIKVEEQLTSGGRNIAEASREEFSDACRKAVDSI